MISVLPEDQDITVFDSNPLAIVAHANVPANPFISKQHSENVTNKTRYKTGNDSKEVHKQSSIVGVSRPRMRESQSLTPMMVKKKARGLRIFDPDNQLPTKDCLPANGIVEALPNRPF